MAATACSADPSRLIALVGKRYLRKKHYSIAAIVFETVSMN